jgi:acyl-CoA thioester hydrolase
MKGYHFELEMQVRDYECDIQGIVNNSVYQNYMEHCRHQFLKHVGLDFAQLHNEGIDAVVVKAELEYKSPLKPGDDFFVRLTIGKQGRLRIIFNQKVMRKEDEKTMVIGKITTVLTRNGRPISPESLEEKIIAAGIKIEEIN